MAPPKEENIDDALVVVNRKITEIKKKIQLSEGQRKAHFEECDAEKKKNIEKIRQLKKEVKEIYKKLANPPQCDDSLLKTCPRYPKDIGALRNKRKDEAVVVMDHRCIDLNKKLDILRYQNRVKQEQLKRLGSEHRELLTKTIGSNMRKVETVRSKPVCLLENQIHRVEMNMMEAEHVNKKYKTIRIHLLKDSVQFESSLAKIQQEIKKQENEISKLEVVNKEALGLRDLTKGTLLRQEISALNAGKNRDNQLQDFRRRVEERKTELERLERRIFPAGRVVNQDSGDASQTGVTDEATLKVVSGLEANFAKLKLATGETETEEVLQRFLCQKEMRTRLTYLKTITEKEKKELELRKDMNLAELEAFKFAEVKDKEQNQEEVEKLNNAIEEQRKLKESHDNEAKRVAEQLFLVREHLYTFVEKLQDMDDSRAPEPAVEITSYTEVLECLAGKVKSALKRIGLGDTFEEALKNLAEKECDINVSEEFTEEDSILFPRMSPQEEGKQQKSQPPSLLLPETEDEEDVPTRSYLKRQAQLIVDAKSRRKFNRVLNFPKKKNEVFAEGFKSFESFLTKKMKVK